MKKEDLKTGMLCQTRSGNVYMFLNNIFVRNNGYTSFKTKSDDLTNPSNDNFDIIKVSEKLEDSYLMPILWTLETLNANLLWERQEVPEYVEVLINSYSSSNPKGTINKVSRITEGGWFKLKSLDSDYEWNYKADEVKPSTKEAYEAQFKSTEMTIEELEELTGLKNLKIKK